MAWPVRPPRGESPTLLTAGCEVSSVQVHAASTALPVTDRVPGDEFNVVSPGLPAGPSCDQPLKAREESDLIKGRVAPSGGDAIGLLMRLAVVQTVLSSAQDNTPTLKPSYHGSRRTLMRPLMKLVGEHSHAAEPHAEGPEGAPPGNAAHQEQGQRQNRDLEEGDIPIAIDEVAAEEIIGVEVVHPEWAQEAPPQDGHGFMPPGVGKPMDHAGSKIRRDHPKDPHQEARWMGYDQRQASNHQEDQQDRCGHDRRSFKDPCRRRELIMSGQGLEPGRWVGPAAWEQLRRKGRFDGIIPINHG